MTSRDRLDHPAPREPAAPPVTRVAALLRAVMWRPVALLLLAVLFVQGCGDSTPTEPPRQAEARETGIVVNSIEVTLTLFDVDDPIASVRTVELAAPNATPVGASARGALALVPLGLVPAAAVVDLATGSVARTVPLPEGSGATGSIFLTDSTALVANPMLGTVSPVNVLAGTREPQIEVGGFPNAFARAGDRIFVVNGELEEWVPARASTLTVLDANSLEVLGEVGLSGENAGAAVTGPDDLLYVLNSGSIGAQTASLSVVDPELMAEIAHHEGFGDLPGSLVAGAGGLLHVASWSFGVAAWDPAEETFVRSPADPIAPGGIASSAGVGVDEEGRLYALLPDCEQPAGVVRLGPLHDDELEIPVGICPAGITFSAVPEEGTGG